MSKVLSREAVCEALEAAGLEEAALYEAYSGRWMFGASCVGLEVSSVGEAMTFVTELARAEPEVAAELAAATTTDQLGLGLIVYWPGYELEGEEA